MNRYVEIKVLFLCLITFLISCQQKEDTTIIGAILPLTGDLASYGTEIQNGIELAIEESNQNVQILYEDDQGQPKNGVNSIEKLSLQGVDMIIGAVPSSVTLSIAPIAEKEKIVLLSPASSSPDISAAGDFVFRNYPSDVYEGRAVAELALKEGFKSFLSITINNDYGIGLKKVFSQTVNELGGKVLQAKEFSEGETNFKPILIEIKEYIKDDQTGIFIVGYGAELGRIIRQSREIGIKNQFFSTVNFLDENTIQTGGNAIEGTIFSSPAFHENSENPAVAKFIKNYVEKYNIQPTVWSAHGYDAIQILLQASSKTENSEEIKNNLYGLKDFPGVSGKTSFDENGDVIKELGFMTVDNGKFVLK